MSNAGFLLTSFRMLLLSSDVTSSYIANLGRWHTLHRRSTRELGIKTRLIGGRLE